MSEDHGRPTAERDLSLHEKRVDAMLALLGRADPECSALHKRLQRQLSTRDYDHEPYYDRWLAALKANLVDAGVLSEGEIEQRLRDLAARRKEEEDEP